MSIFRILGIVSGCVYVIAYLPYVLSIIKKKTRPHPVSWVLWALIGGVTLFLYLRIGAHETVPLAVLNFILPLAIAIVSVRYWKGGLSRFDKICLALSLAAVIIYAVTHDATLALSFNLVGDFFAFLPTLKKAYLDPASEDGLTWILIFIGNCLSLAAAFARPSYGILIFPAYLTFFSILMCVFIFRGRLKKA